MVLLHAATILAWRRSKREIEREPLGKSQLPRALVLYGATTLLCLVAASQLVQMARHPERPRWKRGGFGMYSELYRVRHFCRFDEEAPGVFPTEQYQAAVSEFLGSGEEERIDRLYDSLKVRGVPVEQVIVARKRLDVVDGEYRVRFVRSQAYPPRVESKP